MPADRIPSRLTGRQRAYSEESVIGGLEQGYGGMSTAGRAVPGAGSLMPLSLGEPPWRTPRPDVDLDVIRERGDLEERHRLDAEIISIGIRTKGGGLCGCPCAGCCKFPANHCHGPLCGR